MSHGIMTKDERELLDMLGSRAWNLDELSLCFWGQETELCRRRCGQMLDRLVSLNLVERTGACEWRRVDGKI